MSKIDKIIVRVGDLQVEYSARGEGVRFLEDLGRAFVKARGNEAVLKAGALLARDRQYCRSFVARSEDEAYRGAIGYDNRTVYVGDGVYFGTMYDTATKVLYMTELAYRLGFPVDIRTIDGRPTPEEAFTSVIAESHLGDFFTDAEDGHLKFSFAD